MDLESKLADYLRQGADTLTNLPTEAQRFLTNPQAFTQLVTGKNPLPKETGFVAGATGLPAKNPVQGGVLNPASAPYQEGYEQGEPVAIASMALPAYATALRAGAPKAYNALENYMVKSGGMLPLEAYHGTPHKIQGQFDINKVGTGEGAQAYGHGMYFAEAPDVAKTFMTVGGQGEFVRLGDKVVPTASQEGQVLADVTKLGRKAAINKYPDQADYIKTINPDNIQFEGGNLYKVDIPDADIPNMLQWDKPLTQQSSEVRKALAQYMDGSDTFISPVKGSLYNPTGKQIYEAITKDTDAFSGKGSKIASEQLNALGIKGIRYLDEGSRSAGKGTSNFVVFDPSTVKILEENSKPIARKELIQQQIDKIE
jgi:hypothetical protein